MLPVGGVQGYGVDLYSQVRREVSESRTGFCCFNWEKFDDVPGCLRAEPVSELSLKTSIHTLDTVFRGKAGFGRKSEVLAYLD